MVDDISNSTATVREFSQTFQVVQLELAFTQILQVLNSFSLLFQHHINAQTV